VEPTMGRRSTKRPFNGCILVTGAGLEPATCGLKVSAGRGPTGTNAQVRALPGIGSTVTDP
jgi:hypothetical protein